MTRKTRLLPPKRDSLGPLLSYNFPRKGDMKAPIIVPGRRENPAWAVETFLTSTRKLGMRKLLDRLENWKIRKGRIPKKIVGSFKIRMSRNGCWTVRLRQMKKAKERRKTARYSQLTLAPSSKLEMVIKEKERATARERKPSTSKGRLLLPVEFCRLK